MGHAYFRSRSLGFFFFNDTATTEIYTLSLHDALPILFDMLDFALDLISLGALVVVILSLTNQIGRAHGLNSSHLGISYAVFCLKKKVNLSSRCSYESLSPSLRRRVRCLLDHVNHVASS